ncbi:MAG: hypothetical protein K9G38_02455 [Bacteroidales bacterium]|nr:hypothetical protein [Bacteroidales bacterium]
MKKLVAIVAIVAFMGGMTAPAFANDNASVIAIELADKDPKKAEKKAEKKSDKKSSDCSTTEKAAKKSSDCSTEKKTSDCNTPCGDKK